MKKFTERLKSLRGNDTMASFAKKIGVSTNTYQHYEYGVRAPSLSFIIAVYHKLDVSADWLLGLSDDRSGSGLATATNGSAAATGNARATVNASADTDRLLRIIESQQAVIATLAASVQGAYAASVAAEK